MNDSSEQYHEPTPEIPAEVRERHRAIASLREELEAVDWYDQRVAATSDSELQRILEHNRDEEKEHAAMLIEWLRRNDSGWDTQLREFLFQSGEVAATPHSSHHAEPRTLGLGGLREGANDG